MRNSMHYPKILMIRVLYLYDTIYTVHRMLSVSFCCSLKNTKFFIYTLFACVTLKKKILDMRCNGGLNAFQKQPNRGRVSKSRYIRDFRVEPCPLFKQHQCQQHRPYTCFNWHFANQRRRRPIRKSDNSFNYSPDIYCDKYDENTGICPDGDASVSTSSWLFHSQEIWRWNNFVLRRIPNLTQALKRPTQTKGLKKGISLRSWYFKRIIHNSSLSLSISILYLSLYLSSPLSLFLFHSPFL